MAKKIMQAITKENSYGRRMVPEYLIEKLEKAPAKLVASGSIKDLTTDEINDLQAGDIVVKTTGNQEHTYIVTYKEEGQGICLTYVDASVVETVSFDYVDGEWVYNSTDVTSLEKHLYQFCLYISSNDTPIFGLSTKGFDTNNNHITLYDAGSLNNDLSEDTLKLIYECIKNNPVESYDSRNATYGLSYNDGKVSFLINDGEEILFSDASDLIRYINNGAFLNDITNDYSEDIYFWCKKLF